MTNHEVKKVFDYLEEIDRLSKEVQSQVHGSRTGDEGLGGINDVGIDIPAGVVDGAKVSDDQVARIFAQVMGERPLQAQLLHQAANVLLSGRRVRFDVVQGAADVATN